MSARLSSPIEGIGDHYEVVVIGSGYGGGIAASRLARGAAGVRAGAGEGAPAGRIPGYEP
jgi:hypothetical protein